MLDTRTSVAILMLQFGGCAPQQQPDLVRLYAPAAAKPKAHPFIVIPGVMGSPLGRIDNHREIWPGSSWELVFAGDFDDLALKTPAAKSSPVRRSPPS